MPDRERSFIRPYEQVAAAMHLVWFQPGMVSGICRVDVRVEGEFIFDGVPDVVDLAHSHRRFSP